MVKFEKLFEPVAIGNVELKNRITLAPYGIRMAGPDGCVNKRHIDYYKAKAKGGVGLIEVEAAAINNREAGPTSAGILGVYSDYHLHALNELAETIKMYTRAILQITHLGREVTPADIGGLTAVAPSPIPDPVICDYLGKTYPVRELKIDEIETIENEFAEAAGRARRAGFDGVELHGCHGYLLAEFLSPLTNKRGDGYGGSLENRARFVLETIQRMRERVTSDFPIIYRISADEFIEGGLRLEESVPISKMLEDVGVDCIHVSGSVYTTCDEQVPPMYVPHGNLVHLAEAVKKAVQVPIITVGGINTPEFAEKILEDGKADLVSLGRALVADPEWPSKALEGRPEDIIPCIRCNHCLWRETKRSVHRCSTNFFAGREGDYEIRSVEEPRKVLVAGGGPAGLEAARIAALRGHEVTLYEKSSKLGGLLHAATVPEFKKDIVPLIEYLSRQIKKLGVKLVLGREATPEVVKKIGPYALIVAVGSPPEIQQPKGVDQSIHITSVDALLRKTGNKILIAGGGYIGCDVAAFLSGQGKQVTVITRREKIMTDMEYFARKRLLKICEENKVRFMTDVMLHEVKGKSAVIMDRNWRRTVVDVDNVVHECRQCNGMRQCYVCLKVRNNPVKQFINSAPIVRAVGDCLGIGDIEHAMHSGFLAGYEI